MARQNHGPLSRAKGKLGGVVYQQYEGMQVSREYQPVVKNPQTEKQVINRAKFKMSSQIVAQFKYVLSIRLSKLAIYERMRRAAAVNAIYAVIDDGDPQTPQALVDSVVGAINAKSVSSITAPTMSASGTTLSISANSGVTVFFTICEYDATKGDLANIDTGSYDSDGTAHTTTISATYRSVVMAVAVRALDEEGRATISNIRTTSNAWQNEIARAVAAGDVEISNMAGLVNNPS